MSCCGPQKTTRLTERHRLQVQYTGGLAIDVLGPVTHQSYRFSGRIPIQDVDPRDAVLLAQDRRFRVMGISVRNE